MTWELWTILIITIQILITAVDGRQNGLYDIYRVCVNSEKQVTLGCPEHHIVVIADATHHKSKGSGCNTQEADRCKVKEEDRTALFNHCYPKKVCMFTVTKPTAVPVECDGYQGDNYIEITYKCEPSITGPKGQFLKMCSNFTFTGSLVFLSNIGFPSSSDESPCSCDIKTASKTYLEFKILQFEDTLQSHSPVSYCPQTLHFWTDHQSGTEHTVCSHDADVNKPLNISTDSHAVVNLEATRVFMLILIIQVYHEDEMTITCVDKSALPPKDVPTTAPTTTTATTESVIETTTAERVPTTTTVAALTTSTVAATTTSFAEPTASELISTLDPKAGATTTDKTDGSEGQAVTIPIVVAVVVILFVIIILLMVGVIYLRHTREKERKEARREQTERFAFENVTYDTRTNTTSNGTGHTANGTSTMIVGNGGIVSSQNGIGPYTSPLDGARGDRKYSSIRNQASGENKESDEKIHIYDHHESRPVEWPPKQPPGHRLSFRDSKVNTERESPYEELPSPEYQTLPERKEPGEDQGDNNTNNSNNSAGGDSENASREWQTVEPEPPPLPSTESRPSLNSSFPVLNPRHSVSLHSGLDADMTNITQSTT